MSSDMKFEATVGAVRPNLILMLQIMPVKVQFFCFFSQSYNTFFIRVLTLVAQSNHIVPHVIAPENIDVEELAIKI